MTPRDLPVEFHEQLFGVRRSRRYHQKRRDFYQRLGRTITWASLLFGAGATVAILADVPRPATLALAFAITAANLMAIIGEFRQTALSHQKLLDAFIDLESEFSDLDPSADAIARLRRRRNDLEKSEPATLRVLDAICHNEQARSEGQSQEYFVPISMWQAIFAHVFDVCPSRLCRYDASTESAAG